VRTNKQPSRKPAEGEVDNDQGGPERGHRREQLKGEEKKRPGEGKRPGATGGDRSGRGGRRRTPFTEGGPKKKMIAKDRQMMARRSTAKSRSTEAGRPGSLGRGKAKGRRRGWCPRGPSLIQFGGQREISPES